MKAHLTRLGLLSCVLAVYSSALQAAITVPGADGSDGNLVITANTEIDLSQAVNANWDAGNAANAGKGVYDASKWAVVFKYASVTVNTGVTVTFKNHPSRAPVVWLVSGNVTIAGTVHLDGQIGQTAPAISEPGPGGHRGGSGYVTTGVFGGAGFGVGGGGTTASNDVRGHGASYGSVGLSGPAIYGNPSLIPLIGGSGGGGHIYNSAGYPGGGGAGGGAFLIACQGSVSLTGTLRANGGAAAVSSYTGGGSGGGIRIVADSMSGAGNLSATGGAGYHENRYGGLGRIRIEQVTNTGSIIVNPDPSVVGLTSGATATLWPPSTAPSVKILSVGGVNAPTDPRASFGALGPDVAVAQASSVPVIIRTENVEQASQVQIRITPRTNASFSTVNATVDTVVSNTPLVINWIANVPTNVGYSALQVKVIRP